MSIPGLVPIASSAERSIRLIRGSSLMGNLPRYATAFQGAATGVVLFGLAVALLYPIGFMLRGLRELALVTLADPKGNRIRSGDV